MRQQQQQEQQQQRQVRALEEATVDAVSSERLDQSIPPPVPYLFHVTSCPPLPSFLPPSLHSCSPSSTPTHSSSEYFMPLPISLNVFLSSQKQPQPVAAAPSTPPAPSLPSSLPPPRQLQPGACSTRSLKRSVFLHTSLHSPVR